MTPAILLHALIGAAVLFALVALFGFGRRIHGRHRVRTFQRRRVTLEHVLPFRVKGCKTCGGSGIVKRTIKGLPPKSPSPCQCAGRRFIAAHGQDTKLLGPFRIWKRGRGPANGHPGARTAARGAVA